MCLSRVSLNNAIPMLGVTSRVTRGCIDAASFAYIDGSLIRSMTDGHDVTDANFLRRASEH